MNKKPSTLYSYVLALFSRKSSEIHQNDGITSILLTVSEYFSTKPIKNNLLQLQLFYKIIFNDHSAVK